MMRILSIILSLTMLMVAAFFYTQYFRQNFSKDRSTTDAAQFQPLEKVKIEGEALSTKRVSNGKINLNSESTKTSAKSTGNFSDTVGTSKPNRIENEYTINFDSDDDLNQFLKLAHDYGVDIVDTIEMWNSVRLRVKDLNQFNDLISQGPTPNEYSSNYFIRTPDLPGLPENSLQIMPSDLEAFGDQALKWLGLEDDSKFRGQDIMVAVLDTGVSNHPTFKQGAVEQISLLEGTSSVDGDYGGHGTAVASIISGNSDGAAGVAPDAEILSIQVLDANGVGDAFTVAKGILEAVDSGADIINLSLGTYGDSPEMRRAVMYAKSNGVAVVAAVGNDGLNGISYPARYDEVIAVTGVDPMGQHVPFANQGFGVDLAAPATGINAAWIDDERIIFSGTSASAPFVSGALAGVMAANPNLSAEEALDILIANSNDSGAPGPDPIIGKGILDIGRVQNRDKPRIYDVALASHSILPESNNKFELIVSAQNRGTEMLQNIQLSSVIDGVEVHTQFKNVDVGETVSERYPVDRDKLLKTGQVQIKSSVSIDGRKDSKAINNNRTSAIIYN